MVWYDRSGSICNCYQIQGVSSLPYFESPWLALQGGWSDSSSPAPFIGKYCILRPQWLFAAADICKHLDLRVSWLLFPNPSLGFGLPWSCLTFNLDISSNSRNFLFFWIVDVSLWDSLSWHRGVGFGPRVAATSPPDSTAEPGLRHHNLPNFLVITFFMTRSNFSASSVSRYHSKH